MNLAVTFFLLLSLLAGNGRAAAKSHKVNHTFATALDIQKPRVIPNQVFIIDTNDLRHENPYFISVEDVNEENIIRKHVFPAGYILAFSYEIISGPPDTSSSDSLSPYRYLPCTGSCKYIEQRVLRI
ncbi:MAG TPA: hypothetical protein VF490_07150 [Chryseosolibacter sp.]